MYSLGEPVREASEETLTVTPIPELAPVIITDPLAALLSGIEIPSWDDYWVAPAPGRLPDLRQYD